MQCLVGCSNSPIILAIRNFFDFGFEYAYIKLHWGEIISISQEHIPKFWQKTLQEATKLWVHFRK